MLSRALICCLILSGSLSAQVATDRKGIAFFEKNIRPVLVKQCYRCHSREAKKGKGGLYLDTRVGLRKGGDSGRALIPKDAKNSLLMKALRHSRDLQMPPSKKLPDSVIARFQQWINMGAPDPRGGKSVANKPKVNSDLWCLKPITSPKPPKVSDESWPRSDIDRFILARLDLKKLVPVEDADAVSLLRRLSFDLTGIPPTIEEIDQFKKAIQSDQQLAIEYLVDRLLKSPRFGERWGRHWLDVARFAESNGMDRDVVYPHAWRYRRYVFDSFNADKPYDQFIREQIAGDLLSTTDSKEREEFLIATGFLALGPKPFMQRGERFNMDVVDDQIDATTRAFLGLTVSCARCHDHKFDPIPTKDYYSMASIFRSTKTFGGARTKGPGNLFRLPSAKGEAVKKPTPTVNRAEIQRELRAARKKLRALQQKGRAKARKQIQALSAQVKKLQAQLRRAGRGNNQGGSGGRFAMAVQDEANPRDLNILVRGELNQKGRLAPRGFLSAVHVEKDIKVDRKQSGRLQLAKWISEPSNPLTARVMVNRIWHHLFGRGLVRTVDNFGNNGEEPSHPQLLDYLADQFKKDWSIKKLIRRIVLSRSYQLAATYREENYEIDPANALVWRHTLRRLDGEAIRDAMLSASGRLNLTPPKKSPVTEVGYGEVGRGINMVPLQRENLHRSAYLPVLRGVIPEMLKVFDFAEPSLVVGRRSITTVPAQALYLMNSPFVLKNAESLALELLKLKDASTRIETAYQRCLTRKPSNEEIQRVTAFIERSQTRLKENKEKLAWTSFCQAILASAEFRYLN